MKLGGTFLKRGRTTPEQFEAALEAMAEREMALQFELTVTDSTCCLIKRDACAKNGVLVLRFADATLDSNTTVMWKTPFLSFPTGEVELLVAEVLELFHLHGWEDAV